MNTPTHLRHLLSFEFFPPKTAQQSVLLLAVHEQLKQVNPGFFSVTYGAGGSTRDGTLATVTALQQAGSELAPHLSCIGQSLESLRELLSLYRQQGIRRIVALRGDLPSGMGGGCGDLAYASELVDFIRKETGDWFHIDVAAYPETHPQALTPRQDIDYFVKKMQAGANTAITQYFYNADAYFRFVEEVAQQGIHQPIVPGIMPITNYTQLARFSEACGTEIPRWVLKRLSSFGEDKQGLLAFGLDVVTRLCERLIHGGAPGLHFYTMNQALSSLEISRRLGFAK